MKAETWPERAAKETCRFSERCATANFFATYDDMADCRADNEAALQAEADDAEDDGCVFDRDLAKDCLDALDASCRQAGQQSETLFDPCLDVWDCDDANPAFDTGT